MPERSSENESILVEAILRAAEKLQKKYGLATLEEAIQKLIEEELHPRPAGFTEVLRFVQAQKREFQDIFFAEFTRRAKLGPAKDAEAEAREILDMALDEYNAKRKEKPAAKPGQPRRVKKREPKAEGENEPQPPAKPRKKRKGTGE